MLFTGFIVDDGEDIELESILGGGDTSGFRRFPRFDSIPQDTEQLNLLPHTVDTELASAEEIADAIQERYRKRAHTSRPVPEEVLDAVVGGVRWVEAEIDRDNALDQSVRGSVSIQCFIHMRQKVMDLHLPCRL